MTAHSLHRHSAPSLSVPRWLIVGFVSGAIAVLLFHQGAFALLHALGLVPRAPYSLAATAPLGIPLVWSLAFWGGVWGVALAAALWGLGTGLGLALLGRSRASGSAGDTRRR